MREKTRGRQEKYWSSEGGEGKEKRSKRMRQWGEKGEKNPTKKPW